MKIENFDPIGALVVYKNKDEYYLESHHINKKGKLGSGTPLKRKAMVEIFKAFNSKLKYNNIIPEFLPENIIVNSHNTGALTLMWYRRKKRYNLIFEHEQKTHNFNVQIPNMIFLFKDDDLYVYAVKTDKRPTESTKLYHAPFPNISMDGKVCLGTITVNDHYRITDIIEEYENVFFNSEFNHEIESDKRCKNNIFESWKSAHMLSFNNNLLVPTKLTIKELLNKL